MIRSNLYAAFWDVHRAHVKLGRELGRLFVGLFRTISGQKQRSELHTCPVCLGQKKVAVPPHVAASGGKIMWLAADSHERYPCPTCGAKGYIREGV